MAQSLNRVMLIGVVGREPEMRYTARGEPVTTFSIATTHQWVDEQGETRHNTDWFNVVAWRELAEQCYECLHKDARVFVEGRLQTRSFADEDGRPQFVTEVVLTDMIALGPGVGQS